MEGRLVGDAGVLPAELQTQLNNGRQLLRELRDALTRFGASAEDQAALASSIRQLDEFFLLVGVGEFNAGKSAFINALAGQPVLRVGVTPTTARIHVLKYGDTLAHGTDEHGRSRIEEAVAPYSRFVRAERERWTEARATLGTLRDRAGTFRDRLAA